MHLFFFSFFFSFYFIFLFILFFFSYFSFPFFPYIFMYGPVKSMAYKIYGLLRHLQNANRHQLSVTDFRVVATTTLFLFSISCILHIIVIDDITLENHNDFLPEIHQCFYLKKKNCDNVEIVK